MTERIKVTPMLKRYISPLLVLKWVKEFDMPFEVSVDDVSYTTISDIGLSMASKFVSEFDEQWFAERFALPASNATLDLANMIEHSEAFWGGTLIGVQNLETSMESVGSLITLPCLDDLERQLTTQTDKIRKQVAAYEKRKKSADEEPYVLPSVDSVPIDPSMILNSFEWSKAKSYELSEYTIPLVPVSSGSLEDPESWKLTLDLTIGVADVKEQLRLVGVCNIDENNLLTKKNMRDMNAGHFAMTCTDQLGAFGLNMPMQNVVLLENHRIEILRQLAGRVGRASQKDAGRIFIKSPEIFQALVS